ncbi:MULTISPECIES: sedoheptulose 7-phosphate cyclase [unclassified Nocardia]|uniref:sedoheptulose 7-phosphate cyclase n=1 Tax=unclassified Nocardia TaxID=2637762 RepID=UPI0027E01B94|nr:MULTISPECIES: sedoheptulose 7-phosphate cyclase [unclassified Nocardia]
MMQNLVSSKHGLVCSKTTDLSWTVEAVKQIEYQVRIADDLFGPGNDTALFGLPGRQLSPGDRRLVVIDTNVAAIHGDRIRNFFDANDIETQIVPVTADETVKRWDSVTAVVDAMNDFRIDRRREPVIAIGGGVLTDVVGFAASIFRRGTPYIRIPTTLIGLVDAGVGVKTGINYKLGKNRLGTYQHADVTLLDRTFLRTLQRRHISNGLGEILKMALIKSRELFELLENSGRDILADHFQGSTQELDRAARTIIAESIHLMLEELQPNLWEATLERCVDYGHTFSPTIEMHALPELLHGEAVSIDMALTTAIGMRRGYITEADAARVFRVMRALELPLWNEVLARPGILDAALADTVRHRDGQQRLPLPVGIGHHLFVNDLTPQELHAGSEYLATVEVRFPAHFDDSARTAG